MRFLERLPPGTFLVGGGLLLNGLAAYTFLAVAARNLGPEAYTPVGMLWALSFMLGPGFFQPLEQETARTIASRVGHGVVPVVRSAAAIGGLVALGLAVVAAVAGPWMVGGLFDGESWLLVGLLLVVVGLGSAHLVKGVLAGLGRFGGYARYVVGEGLGRLLVVGLLVAVVSDGIGSYGLAIGLAPFVGIGAAMIGQRGLRTPGLPVPMSDLSRTLGALLVASVATAVVLNVSPLTVETLAGPGEGGEPGRFLNALLVARIPLFFFQAVQAALLPQLSGLVGAGRYGELWGVLRRLLTVVGTLGLAVVVAAAVAGPWAVEFAFGSEYAVARRDMVLLTTSSVGLMVVLSLAQGLIACRCPGRMAIAWVAGLAAFPVMVALSSDLFLRVEVALITTVALVAGVMAVLLVNRIRREVTSSS